MVREPLAVSDAVVLGVADRVGDLDGGGVGCTTGGGLLDAVKVGVAVSVGWHVTAESTARNTVTSKPARKPSK